MDIDQRDEGRKLKICLVGESTVGKTSLVSRLMSKAFRPDNPPTIGGAFQEIPVTIDNVRITLMIWDTAGSEQYRSVGPLYYHGSAGALIVYDITSRASFERCAEWHTSLGNNAGGKVAIILVGNKTDLESQREVSADEGRAFVQQKELAAFIETSALDGSNVTQAFTDLARGANAIATPEHVFGTAAEACDIESGCC
jgi:small GTP-binding protein